ncbi:MAG: amidohydrolase [Halieaceae bacterium]|jgi:amidohydrolase|nr:amidohydrolase [Halieaceae bacterium]
MGAFFFRICVVLTALAGSSGLWAASIKSSLSSDYDYLEGLYKHLHQHPELSYKEKETSARVAAELQEIGFTVTERVGGYGVVAILVNGSGPTLMLRTDTDALPVQEQTGLAYASQVRTVDGEGQDVGIMHACGHDMHMTVLVGAARQMVQRKQDWQGTLMLIAQPAEERGGGAKAMLADGLFERFPRPDFNFAFHVSAGLPVGQIGFASGYVMANVDSVDIKVHGVGGHGAYPHMTKDPVVLAARIITSLQTIVSRELSPLEPAVITVGSIHGGTKHNIIGNSVDLQLTVRSYSDQTRDFLLRRIREISIGEAQVAAIPQALWPSVRVKDEYTPSTYNQPDYTARIVQHWRSIFAREQLVEVSPVMGGEDFSRYGRVEPKIPSALFWLGTVDPQQVKTAAAKGIALPSLHSAKYAPLPEPSIMMGVEAMTEAALMLLAR